MGTSRSSQSRSILPLLLIAVLFVLFWYKSDSNTPEPITVKMSDSVDVISKLQVAVRQVSTSPPKLVLAVKNTHSGPVTVLSWNSPLDPLAVQLGLLSFTPAGSDEPVEIPTIQIRRKMPPGPDSLITMEAGQTKEQELELKGPIVPLDKLRGKVSVVCSGEWMGVWPSEADAITKVSLEQAGASEDTFRGSFQSEAVEIEI
ncbi:hypothetical protein F4677DRAFT_424856 [Hypoxylon crocopeplum]|nr:hypothetical protein F4677DRAFT_424856 [Hypoxylon crocopeplum]